MLIRDSSRANSRAGAQSRAWNAYALQKKIPRWGQDHHEFSTSANSIVLVFCTNPPTSETSSARVTPANQGIQ